MKYSYLLLLLLGSSICGRVYAVASTHISVSTPVDSNYTEVDDLQIELVDYRVQVEKGEAQVSVFLSSLAWDPRELKLNNFGLQLLDTKGRRHLFKTVQLANVLIQAEEGKNYLNYLLKADIPVKLTVSYHKLPKDFVAQEFFLVFEDSKEEGHFFEIPLALSGGAQQR